MVAEQDICMDLVKKVGQCEESALAESAIGLDWGFTVNQPRI
jgi:hypothetical protein